MSADEKKTRKAEILVVDDDDAIVETLRVVLEQEGYLVRTASNGGEAFEIMKSEACDCMLMDMNMPHINGAELLLLMQASDIHIPTIVMAGFEDFDEKELQQFPNVVRYFHKPFEPPLLLATVKECLEMA